MVARTSDDTPLRTIWAKELLRNIDSRPAVAQAMGPAEVAKGMGSGGERRGSVERQSTIPSRREPVLRVYSAFLMSKYILISNSIFVRYCGSPFSDMSRPP